MYMDIHSDAKLSLLIGSSSMYMQKHSDAKLSLLIGSSSMYMEKHSDANVGLMRKACEIDSWTVCSDNTAYLTESEAVNMGDVQPISELLCIRYSRQRSVRLLMCKS